MATFWAQLFRVTLKMGEFLNALLKWGVDIENSSVVFTNSQSYFCSKCFRLKDDLFDVC